MSTPSSSSAPRDWQLLPQDYQDEILARAVERLPHSEGAPPTLLSLSERNPKELEIAIEAVAKSKLEAFRSGQDRLRTAFQFTLHEIEVSDNPLLTLSINAEIRRWVCEVPAGEKRELAAFRILGWIRNPSQKLCLCSLGLSTLPNIFHHPAFKNLEALELRANRLTALPESIGNLAALKELDLCDNQLIAIPESIGRLAALQSLSLISNQLRALPESFGNLIALQFLYLQGNRLTTLPESFGDLIALQSLSLSYLPLMALPESFGKLIALQFLDLSFNQLMALPESIGRLAALQSLVLISNRLSTLPESFGDLIALRFLYLRDNPLTALPESIGRLTALKDLDLYNTSLMGLPNSLLHGSITSACEVLLVNVPLSPHVRTAISEAVSLPTYQGPRLFFSMSIPLPAPEGRPLSTSSTR